MFQATQVEPHSFNAVLCTSVSPVPPQCPQGPCSWSRVVGTEILCQAQSLFGLLPVGIIVPQRVWAGPHGGSVLRLAQAVDWVMSSWRQAWARAWWQQNRKGTWSDPTNHRVRPAQDFLGPKTQSKNSNSLLRDSKQHKRKGGKKWKGEGEGEGERKGQGQGQGQERSL